MGLDMQSQQTEGSILKDNRFICGGHTNAQCSGQQGRTRLENINNVHCTPQWTKSADSSWFRWWTV